MVLHVRLTKNSRGLSGNTTACVSFIRYNDSSLIYVPIGSRRSRTFHTHHLRKNPTSLWFLRESNRFCKELPLRYDEEELFLSVCFCAQKRKITIYWKLTETKKETIESASSSLIKDGFVWSLVVLYLGAVSILPAAWISVWRKMDKFSWASKEPRQERISPFKSQTQRMSLEFQGNVHHPFCFKSSQYS